MLDLTILKLSKTTARIMVLFLRATNSLLLNMSESALLSLLPVSA